jgi:hypothetical protein
MCKKLHYATASQSLHCARNHAPHWLALRGRLVPTSQCFRGWTPLMRSFGCLHTSTLGARSSGRALPFPRGCARDLLRKPRLPGSRAALRHFANPFGVWRVTQQVASDSRDALNTATQCSGNPVTSTPAPCPAGRSWHFAREPGSRGFLSVARRTGKPPLRHTTARAVYGLGACHFDKPPSAVLSCVISSTHVTRGTPCTSLALRGAAAGRRAPYREAVGTPDPRQHQTAVAEK